jgi:ubiquinone biosynthesis protein
VTLPAVYEELCTEHVLVIEWLDGVSLRAAAQLIEDRGLDRAALSRALLGVDIAAEAHAYAADRVSGQMAPKAVKKTAADELAELLPVIRRLPRRFDRVTGALEQGRLGLNVRLFADERDRQVVTGLTNRFLLAFLGTASGIVAALLLGAAGGPKVAPTVSLYQIIGYNLLIVAAILVLRVLFTIFRNR